MNSNHAQAVDARRSGLDLTLRIVRFVGLIGFLGGLCALASLWAFGPRPVDESGWHMLIRAMRSIFYPCVFSGIILLIASGVTIWWRRRKHLHGLRWFQVMMAAVFVAVPVLHLSARFTMLRLLRIVEQEQWERAMMLWNRLGMLYLIAAVIFLAIAILAMVKPRLGQRQP
jgi:hypothetical protein